jgi:uncharacterized protein YigE (DUF2233 family)
MRKIFHTVPRRPRAVPFLVLAMSAGLALAVEGSKPAAPAGEAGGWLKLERGLELGTFPASVKSTAGDSQVRVLRIDPRRFDLRLLNASAPGQGEPLPAKEWCRRNGLVAAMNAAMYREDRRTSLSLMKTRDHVNNPSLTRDRTVLAFDPLAPGLPPVRILDRECDDFDALRGRYGSLVQSIRMLSCKGKNVWSQQPRKWSTAAIGTDGNGKVLFIHVRSPYTTHDLIEMLRALPLGLSRLMYAEGGPEAQLYVQGPDREYEFLGSAGSGLNGNDGIQMAWPIPNVVGVARKQRR